MKNNRFYIRPISPDTVNNPEDIDKLADAIVAWVMKIKEEYEKKKLSNG